MNGPTTTIPHYKHDTSWITLTKTWRASGLLREIPGEDLKTLLLVLSFTTDQGDCQPTVQQLAHAMQVSEPKARRRLERLRQSRWQGRPLIAAIHRSDGADAYTIADGGIVPPELAQQVGAADQNQQPLSDHASVVPEPAVTEGESPVQTRPERTRRDEVIEASRRTYGRPRAEVERMIAQQMGWDQPAPSPASTTSPSPSHQDEVKTKLKQQLLKAGVDEDGTQWLLSTFEPERIQRQLDWLAYRQVRNPAGFLMAAIENDYEAPFALRQQQSPNKEHRVQEKQ